MTELMDFAEEPLPSLDNVVPTPSERQLEFLKHTVQQVGGVLLTAVCRPRGIAYPHPELAGRTLMVNTAGCGRQTMALIPQGPGAEAARVCLACDGCYEWPNLYGGMPPAAEEPPPYST